jgi:cytochrome c peroxidase
MLFSGFCLAILFSQSCTKDKEPYEMAGTPQAPSLPAVAYQYDDGLNDTATLGRVLFYDKNLSLNNQVACGSCHKQQFAFAENKSFSQGLFNGYTSRNSSAIISSINRFANGHNRFWDGRAANTDTAVFMPVMNDLEMHVFDLNLLPQKISSLSYYPALFQNAYGSPDITVSRIRNALAVFVDELHSNRSAYDRQELTALQQEGENIFFTKGRCYSCHNGADFNGYEPDYENIGLDVNYADNGRGRITHNENDNGKFMVPTLRNVELSAPYMHDGRYATLREVIDHYDHGIQDSRNLSPRLRDIPFDVLDTFNFPTGSYDPSDYPVVQLGLSEQEKVALEAFLKSLTDPAFVTDPRYSNPFH